MFDRSKHTNPDSGDADGREGGRFSRTPDPAHPGGTGRTATATEVAPDTAVHTGTSPSVTGLTHADYKDVRARQREEFGGIKWGSSFFGWLVAFGVAVLLTGLLSAAGAATGLTSSDTVDSTLGIVGGVLVVAAALVAYYAGGYVAGRMSRFDGGRQGLGVWVIGLLITAALAAVAVIAGSEYNVITEGNLPSFTVGDSEATTGGLIAMALMLVGTLLAAMAGGKAGERYHKKVDRIGITDADERGGLLHRRHGG